jgi:hypothetical protein
VSKPDRWFSTFICTSLAARRNLGPFNFDGSDDASYDGSYYRNFLFALISHIQEVSYVKKGETKW